MSGIGFTSGSSDRSNFFDRKAVKDAAGKGAARVLSRFGAFVRTRDISSMLGHKISRGFGSGSKVTNREGSAPIGEPPAPHLGLIVKHVEFSYEPLQKGVVIGPISLGKGTGALEALEYGGESTIMDHGRSMTVHIGPHPSITPAFTAELEKMPPLWRDSIT